MIKNNAISRRAFMLDLGKGTLAVAVFGLAAAACSSDDSEPTTTAAAAAATTGSTSAGTTPTTATTAATTAPTTSPPAASDGGVAWERVVLGNVSAYILARQGEATIVDTGNPGSENDIEASLGALDLAWGDVGHVIVTHLHGDHQGSLPAVLNLAPDAAAYAGAADIPNIGSPRELTAVGDGDSVFGLEIIDTPGHTLGHISVLDPIGGLLVAGDAMNGADGGVIGANPAFTTDIAMADESIQKLAALTFDTIVFGHGDPVVGLASQQVAAFAASI